MKKAPKLYCYVGTTAELIKVAPVIKELQRRKYAFTLVAAGQNKIKFSEFDKTFGKIKPNVVLDWKSGGSSIARFGVWSLKSFGRSFSYFRSTQKSNQNSIVLIHGDTVSSLIGTVTAKLNGMKVAHIESGLRSFDFFEPFPEEICRFIVSRLADIHYCPNKWSMKNLRHASGDKVNTQQNTLIESYEKASKVYAHKKSPVREKYFVLVIHRQENILFFKNRTKEILTAIFSNVPKNMKCALIMHELTRNFIRSLDPSERKRISDMIIPLNRMSHPEFIHLLNNATFLLTDGGSNQEEAYYIGLPTLILRNKTERIEGLTENVVLSKNKLSVIAKFMNHYKQHKRKPISLKKNPSKIIVDHLHEKGYC